MSKHILCTLLTASTSISGLAFAPSEDPKGMLSVDPVDDDTAKRFASIPGYEIHEIGDGPSAAEREKAEREKAEAAEREAAEREKAEEAAKANAAGEAKATEGDADAGSQQPAAETAPPAQTEAETAPAAEAEKTAAPAKGGKSKGSK